MYKQAHVLQIEQDLGSWKPEVFCKSSFSVFFDQEEEDVGASLLHVAFQQLPDG